MIHFGAIGWATDWWIEWLTAQMIVCLADWRLTDWLLVNQLIDRLPGWFAGGVLHCFHIWGCLRKTPGLVGRKSISLTLSFPIKVVEFWVNLRQSFEAVPTKSTKSGSISYFLVRNLTKTTIYLWLLLSQCRQNLRSMTMPRRDRLTMKSLRRWRGYRGVWGYLSAYHVPLSQCFRPHLDKFASSSTVLNILIHRGILR